MLNYLLGIGAPDDIKFRRQMAENGKGKIILTNSVSILDCFYYANLSPRVKFLVGSPGEDHFTVVSGLAAMARTLRQRQPFFSETPTHGSRGLKQLLIE